MVVDFGCRLGIQEGMGQVAFLPVADDGFPWSSPTPTPGSVDGQVTGPGWARGGGCPAPFLGVTGRKDAQEESPQWVPALAGRELQCPFTEGGLGGQGDPCRPG